MSLAANIPHNLLALAVNQSLDGIVIADALAADMPLIYANAGFEKMTGYSAAEIVGQNCRFLQGKDQNQAAVTVLRDAIRNGENCIVILKNYRKDGTLFWNEFNISPVKNAAGMVTHFIGVQKDVTARVDMLKHLRSSKLELQKVNQQLNVLAMSDGLTGVGNRRYFNEQLQAMFSIAQRTRVPLSILMLDLDYFKRYNDKYGHQAGDDSLIRVGGMIAEAFQRPSDAVCRYGGEEFAVVSVGMSAEELQLHAQQLCDSVRAAEIPHADSPHGVVTISIGGISRVPKSDTTTATLLKLADEALYLAKGMGRNRIGILD